MIKFICDVKIWFDRINGNTYHAVNITDSKTNKLIFSSGLTYGYGEQYKHTAYEGLAKLGLFDLKDRNNHDKIREDFIFCVSENCLKRDLNKIGVGEWKKNIVIILGEI